MMEKFTVDEKVEIVMESPILDYPFDVNLWC